MPSRYPGVVRVEEIMTPRSLFVCVPAERVPDAARLAERYDFEAIPILREGNVICFWSRSAGRVKRITRLHRTEHSSPVEPVLSRLAEHIVQFVHYRGQIVGLVDVSDLNKPLARLVFLGPVLDCEQAIFLTARASRLPEDAIATALGHKAARAAMARRRKAAGEDLNAPLLEFAYFPEVLRAAVALGFISITATELALLADIRNRSAHAGHKLVRRQAETKQLMAALELCRRIRKRLGNVEAIGPNAQPESGER